MTVGYIQCGYGVKQFGYAVYQHVVINDPEVMAEAVGCSEVIFSFSGSDIAYYFLEFVVVGKSEEYRLYMC